MKKSDNDALEDWLREEIAAYQRRNYLSSYESERYSQLKAALRGSSFAALIEEDDDNG